MIRAVCLLMLLAVLTPVSTLVAEEAECVVLVGDSTVASNSGWGDRFGRVPCPRLRGHEIIWSPGCHD